MRVLLDECLPRRLALEIRGHSITTVQQAGWAGVTNGELLGRIAGAHDAFITIDRLLPTQNNIASVLFGIIVLHALSNTLRALRPLVPHILAALAGLQPGQVTHIPQVRP